MSSAIEVLKRLVKEEGLKMSGNEMIYFNKDEFNALKEALLALEQKERVKESLLKTKELLKTDIDGIGDLNVDKNRNKLWFLTGELNIIENVLELMK